MSGIYSAMTPDNRMYVGQTTMTLKRRITCHISCSKKNSRRGGIYEAIRNYGNDNIRWGWIVSGLTCNQQGLNNIETFYIAVKDTYNNGLNLDKIGGCPPRAFGKDNCNYGVSWGRPPESKIVEVRGIVYSSAKEAAEANNITRQTIYKWVRFGVNGARYV